MKGGKIPSEKDIGGKFNGLKKIIIIGI